MSSRRAMNRAALYTLPTRSHVCGIKGRAGEVCVDPEACAEVGPSAYVSRVETREQIIARMESLGTLVPGCAGCRERYAADDPRSIAGPSHVPSRRCESGKQPHCTCDTCF